jgi:hypothetical protein
MAFASVGTLGNNGSTANNQASLAITTSAIAEVNNLVVVIVAVDANATTDGDDNAVASVVSGTNTFTKAVQFANGQGALAAGCSVSIWFCKLNAQINSGGTITITFTSSANSDETAASAWEFTMGATNTPAVEATNTAANDAGATGSLNATTANIECLRIRATATESATATAWTATSGWTLMTLRGSGGTGDAAQHIRGEFRISTGTGDASNPTGGVNPADHASAYAALKEVSFDPAPSMFAVLQY